MVTLNYQVSAGGDDGDFTSSSIDPTDTLANFGSVFGISSIFAKFAGVTIPAGATITAAYISIYIHTKVGTTSACKIYFEDAANPAAPTTAASVNGRTKTTAYVSYTPPGSYGWSNSGDISAIIQELVDSYDYSAGKSMLLLLMGAGSGLNYSTIQTYETSDATTGPKLHIDYTVPSDFTIGSATNSPHGTVDELVVYSEVKTPQWIRKYNAWATGKL